MHITVTMPRSYTREWVDALFDGSRPEPELDFPFDRTSVNIQPGEWVYVIHQGLVCGRLQVTEIQHDAGQVAVGPDQRPINGRTVIWVSAPGEPAGDRCIERRGHQSFRYAHDLVW
jgi:hypothetical protein